jgi:CheY-like chemotaxis protein
MPKTILLADDSVTIQKVVAISFASEDVKVVTVDNGDDAITRTRELRPDIVLADVVMPGKNGYQVCEAIKGDPELAHIPVLLLTGTFEAFDEPRARSVGSAGHIAKPFEAQSLVAEVRRLMEAAAARAPRAPASAPAASSASQAADEGAFDFFDDDLSAPGITPEPVSLDDGIELDFQNAAGDFTFDDDDLAAPASARERSVPIPPAAAYEVKSIKVVGASSFAEAIPIGAELETPAAASADTVLDGGDFDDSLVVEAGSSGEQPFDFAIADDTANPTDSLADLELVPPVDTTDLAHATVIDPLGASGYDVSFSDLGPPIPATRAPSQRIATSRKDEAERTLLASKWQPEVSPGLDTDPFQWDPVANDLTTVVSGDPIYAGIATPPQVEPIAVAVEMEAPTGLASELYAEPARAGAMNARGASTAAPAAELMASIGPELRQQLHDTLEKIAWESFGDLTEAIVRQSVERVEAIAWEVIPRMAEILIQEEIRRLKSEPDEA